MSLVSQIFHSSKSFSLWIKWRKNPGLNRTGYFIFLAGCFSIKFLWCSSFIFMLLKMERIYQMSKLIVIKCSKYWQKTQTCPVTTHNRNNKYFDNIILFNRHRELLKLDLLRKNYLTRNLSTYYSFFIQDHKKPHKKSQIHKIQGKFTETFCSLGIL